MISTRVIGAMLTGVFVIVTSGCFMQPYADMKIPPEHVVMFNGKGKPVDVTGNITRNHYTDFWSDPEMTTEEDCIGKPAGTCQDEYSKHLDNIFAHINIFKSDEKNKKIFIFIHGGLNSSIDSLGTVVTEIDGKERYEHIKEQGYYPIFINWDSSLVSSYLDHLFWVRQGERKTFWGPITVPFILVSDIGRSIIRAPLVWGGLLRNDMETVPYLAHDSIHRYSDAVAKELLCRSQYGSNPKCRTTDPDALAFRQPPYCVPFPIYESPGNRSGLVKGTEQQTFPVEVGEDERGCPEMDAHAASWWPTLPLKMLLAPPIDAFGSSAWDNMLRRVQLMFVSEDELKWSKLTEGQKGKLADLEATGGLSRFFQRLVKESEGQWEIVIVGHSMGTIVTNEIIRNFGDKLNITDVVYLAGATTVRDYEDTMFPYLTRHFGRTRLHHFTLHPEAESGEFNLLDLAPRGSLLVWIDNFLANPLTILDRTVGKYDNLFAAAHQTPPGIREAISIRTYSSGWDAKVLNPQNHSDVAQRFKYWKPECWSPTALLKNCVLLNEKGSNPQ